MRLLVAGAIVALTVVCCLAISHGLDLQIGRERQKTEALLEERHKLRESPEGRRLEELKFHEPRLREALERLNARNDNLTLVLAAADGLGTNLRGLRYDGLSLTLTLAGDTAGPLARLRKLPGGESWEEIGENQLQGKVQP